MAAYTAEFPESGVSYLGGSGSSTAGLIETVADAYEPVLIEKAEEMYSKSLKISS